MQIAGPYHDEEPGSREDSTGWRLCTIVTERDLPSAIALADSFSAHHPQIPITALVVDAMPDDFLSRLPFDVVRPEAISLDGDAFRRMATCYDERELSAAVKPLLLQLLLNNGDDVVMYLDHEIEVFAPLDDLFTMARDRTVLTPHIVKPMARDVLGVPDEETFLLHGQFNLGFIAVSAASGPFLDYWKERTRLFALDEPTSGYFLDQRWVDPAPGMFACSVVRDPTCNVGYWNLHERDLEFTGSGAWTVGGSPLRFFHFSGHNPNEPFRLSEHLTGTPRVRVDQQPALRRMLQERAARVVALQNTADRPPYHWSRTTGGMELTRPIRRLYWDALRRAEQESVAPPPSAFEDDGGRNFLAWLREPVSPGNPVPRHLYARWEDRTDLRMAFPDALGADAGGLTKWAREDPSAIYTTPLALRIEPSEPPAPLSGVNLLGYLDGEFGVAAAGRMLSRMVSASGVPLATTLLRTDAHRHRHPHLATIEGVPFDVTIFAVNAAELLHLSRTAEMTHYPTRNRVGVWYWEVGRFPDFMLPALDLVDEVWCASDHVHTALTASGATAVLKHPLVIDAPSGPTALLRTDLGLPGDRLLYGFVFDYESVLQRKNPTGLIHAYRRAFGPEDGAALVLKTINSGRRPDAAAAVREAADERPDIVFLDQHLDAVQMRGLFGLLDCYVSLHRSEGLGLTIATAMATGTPAIATGWSGNLEFMTAQNSTLIPYDLTEVGPGAYPYPPDACWAEPDLDAAAHAMRELFDKPAKALDLGRRASTVTENHSVVAAADWFDRQFARLSQHGADA
jgi:hypothetical protein